MSRQARNRRVAARAVLVLAGFAAAPAAIGLAPTPAFAAGPKVVEIRFEGNRRYSDDTLRLALRTKVGQELDRALLPEDINTLYQFFDTVDQSEERTPEGVRIVFRVTENPQVGSVDFAGVSAVSLDEVRAVVETAAGRPMAEHRLENDRRKIEKLYRAKGFHFVQATTRAEQDGTARRVVFDVLEGPHVAISKIEFVGNASMRTEKLLDRAVSRERGFLGLRSGDYVEDTLRLDLLAMKALYRSEGWLDADVVLQDVSFSEDRSRASVRIGVTEGEPYTIGAVSVAGVGGFPGGAEALRSAITLTEGARKRDDEIFRSVNALERAYRDEGFFAAVVTPKERLRPQGRVVDIVFEVEESSKVKIRNLALAGNVVTQDKVLRREIKLAPGDVLNQNEIDKSLRRLRDLRYFERVQARIENLGPGEDPNLRDLTFDVDDTAPTGQFRFAVGATSDLGFTGEISLTKRNFDWRDWPESFGDTFSGKSFTGAGQTFSLTLQPGSEVSNYRLAFTEPWMFDKPILFGWDLFLSKFNLFNYSQDRSGIDFTLGRRFTWEGRERDTQLSVSGVTRIESYDIRSVDRDSTPTAFLAEGGNSLIAERFTARLTRVDSETRPTDGFFAEAFTEFGFAGDIRLWKTGAEYRRYIPVHRTEDERVHTLSLDFRISNAVAMGSSAEADPNLFDTEYVPIFESSFAGGSTTVRGFAYGGAGPHGEGNPFLGRKPGESARHQALRLGRTARSVLENDGDPMGGGLLFTASAEYQLPIVEDLLGGVVFLDTGMVRHDFSSSHGLDEDAVDAVRRTLSGGSPNQRRLARSLDYSEGDSFFSDLRAAVGFGFRLKIPVLGPTPIAIDIGIPIRKQDGDDTQVVSFSLERNF